MKNVSDCHKIWHKFSKWVQNVYGKDLFETKYWKIPDPKSGKIKKVKYIDFNDGKFYERLVGYEVIERVEKYVKRFCPEIEIVRCDDAMYAGSIILVVPHPEHGITMLFIPQLTGIQNKMFLYEGHYKMLMKALKKMAYVYKKTK